LLRICSSSAGFKPDGSGTSIDLHPVKNQSFAKPLQQSVRFATPADGVRIAYAVTGNGPPVVKTPNWLTHLEFDHLSPGWSHWLLFLSSRWQLYRTDQRGSGLSDRVVAPLSFEHWVSDLECVVDAAELEHFSLLGISQGGAVAIEYAARHPDKVERLVLYGAYAQGWARRGSLRELRQGRAMVDLVETGWGTGNDAYLQLFTNLFMPDATEEQCRWFNELQSVSTRPEIAARLIEAAGSIDVSHRLKDVRAATLVIHAKDDARVPFEQGRRLAAGIRDARLVSLDSRNHVLLEQDPAWPKFCEAFSEFVPGRRVSPARHDKLPDDLTPRERHILSLLVIGLSNAEIAERVQISAKTVRNHLSNAFSKLGVSTRAQAIIACRDLIDPGR
jgi:pimeloyl-ACP methyl ester carboxylesterase/DNA-binding CsgD family transcriptional regulator